MITRQDIRQFTRDRRELEFIMDEVILDQLENEFLVDDMINDPAGYCKIFFLAKGIELLRLFFPDAQKLGEDFAGGF